jgi:hypothetical protein
LGFRFGAVPWLAPLSSRSAACGAGSGAEGQLRRFRKSPHGEPVPMSFVRSAVISAAVLSIIMSGVALAQTATPEPSQSTSSKVDDVSKWTTKQWNQAKAKWAKEKEKWADCQKQSKDQKLTGRKSWSFLASCMTS